MKFDFVIGNPPYQEEKLGENEGFAPPVYNKFLDAAYEVGDRVEMIHPARFLFNAGSTPKAWNEKMLQDEHFKILQFESDTKKIFANTSITGGIAISYRDSSKEYGAIKVFTSYELLNKILSKVTHSHDFESMEKIVVTRTIYRLTPKLHEDFPCARYKEDKDGNNIGMLSKGHDFDMSSNIFDRLPMVFFEEIPDDGYEYIKMLGRKNNNRKYMYIKREYVKDVFNLDKYKVILAKADGAAGTIGNPIPARVLGTPTIEGPKTGTTESFISVGAFEHTEEAVAAMKYIKTKFARCMLSVLKVTQEITPEKWKYVPLQDFTSDSDINWTVSISEIDNQLFKKYGLSSDEIEFINKYVKEME